MAEDTRSPGDDERPQLLPPDEPSEDGDPPWSHAQAGQVVTAGDEGKAPSTTGALLGIGGGALVILAAIGLVISLLAGDPGKKPKHSSSPRAAPTKTPDFPTGRPASPTPAPPKKAIELPKFSGETSERVGRISDHRAGLSYARLDRPWRDGVPFTASGFGEGQYYVTEKYPGGTWQATIMSGRMVTKTPEYVGTYRWFRSAAAQASSVAGRYYPTDHRTLEVASQPVKVSGRDGWLTASRLYFHEPGLKASNELMVIVAVDTGQKTPGVLYVSVPSTENEHLSDINELVSSLRVIK